jgi:hypothetical protein
MWIYVEDSKRKWKEGKEKLLALKLEKLWKHNARRKALIAIP